MIKKVFLAIIFFGSAYWVGAVDVVKADIDWLNQQIDATGVYVGPKKPAYDAFKKAQQDFLNVGMGKTVVPDAGAGAPTVAPAQTLPASAGSGSASAMSSDITSFSGQSTTSGSKVVIGYYENWTRYSPSSKRPVYTPSMIDVKNSGLTVINYAFVRPYPNAVNILNENVSVEQAEKNVAENLDSLSTQDLNNEETFRNMMTDSWADVDVNKPWNAAKDVVGGSFKELQDLKQNNPGLKIIISFGGWTLSNGFPAATKTEARRKKMATLMVNFVKRYGFGGIDIDWEYPVWPDHGGTPDDKQNYVLFLTELSQQAKANGLLLTLAVAADVTKVEAGMDLPKIYPLVDWMSLMCYDFNGPWGQKYTGHNAPLYNDSKAPGGVNPPSVNGTFNVDAAVKFYLSKGVPASKIVVGMPLYGRSFAGVKNNGNGGLYSGGTLTPGTGTVEAGVVSLSDVMSNYLSNAAYEKFQDDISKVPYLYNSSTGDWVSYDDMNSLAAKAKFVKEQGLRGAMVWPLEQGSIYTKAIRTIADTL